jgi:hypothetical protein
MLAGLQSGYGHRTVQMALGEEGNGVEFIRGQHRFKGRVDPIDLELLGIGLAALWQQICHSDQADCRVSLKERHKTFGKVAATDETDTDWTIHLIVPPVENDVLLGSTRYAAFRFMITRRER